MDFTEKTIQRDIKYSGRIFTVTQDIVELPNGKTSTRDLVFHTGAVAVLVIRDGKMLLVRQYRKPLEMHFLEIPAGKLDSKEEVPLEAAKRELEEETGLVPDSIRLLEQVCSIKDQCHFDYFEVVVSGDKSQVRYQEGETDAHVWLPLKEVPDFVENHPCFNNQKKILNSLLD